MKTTTMVLAITAMASTANAVPPSPRFHFEYNYPYWIRSQCRELTRDANGHTDFNRAIQCAENTLRAVRAEELRRATIANLNAETKLMEQKTKNMRNR